MAKRATELFLGEAKWQMANGSLSAERTTEHGVHHSNHISERTRVYGCGYGITGCDGLGICISSVRVKVTGSISISGSGTWILGGYYGVFCFSLAGVCCVVRLGRSQSVRLGLGLWLLT
jgi:hypothetical protein